MIYLAISIVIFLIRSAPRVSHLGAVYWAVLLFLFLLCGFRYQVGCDWSGYYFQYLTAPRLNVDQLRALGEPAWWFSLRALNRFGFFYPSVHVLASAIFFVGVAVLARKQPDRYSFLVLLFPILIINVTMSGDRQAAAIGLVCVAFSALQERKLVQFVFWTILASCFHASAMIFLLMTPLASGRYTRTRLALAAALSIPGAWAIWHTGTAKISVGRYVGTGVDANGAVFRVGILVISGLYFFTLLRGRWRERYSDDFRLVSIGSIAMILLGPILLISTVIADRFAYYLVPIQAIIFARIPQLEGGKYSRLQSALPYLGLTAVLAIWIFSSRLFHACYVPYETWLFGVPEGPILR